MDRKELKKYIKKNSLSIKVYKTTSDDDIRSQIRELQDTTEEEPEEETEEEEAEDEEKPEEELSPREKAKQRAKELAKKRKGN